MTCSTGNRTWGLQVTSKPTGLDHSLGKVTSAGVLTQATRAAWCPPKDSWEELRLDPT